MSHSHPHPNAAQNTHRLALSLSLTAIFVAVEIGAGIFSDSLALLTDAAHNFTDVIALGLSWFALKIAARPARAGRTYGYLRVEILAALVNSVSLIFIALGIFYEAYRRFGAPPEVNSRILLGVGALAFAVNLCTAWLVKEGSERDLNMRSAFLHLMGDVFSTLGAAAAGAVILFTGWNWLDPLVSALVGVFIFYNAWGILRQTVHILLEHAPRHMNLEQMAADIRAVEGVRDVHDLHVWSIKENLTALSAHIVIDDAPVSACAAIQRAVNVMLAQNYDVRHATLQLECQTCGSGLLYCDIHR